MMTIDPKRIDTINILSIAMVANNIGRAETGIVAGNFYGSIT